MTSVERRPRIALFSKPHRDARAVLHRVAACLSRHRAEILADETAARELALSVQWSRTEAAAQVDLVISVGGDGTLLASARAVGARGTPILGINLGHLGFLTETRTEEVDRVIEAALVGRAPFEARHVLAVEREGTTGPQVEWALNDVVISQTLQRLFSLSLLVNDEWVADYRADGLILATPTGSTAYSLSAGGPVVAPSVDCLIVTPICPHSLAQRPLVLPGTARVTVTIADGEQYTGVQAAFDGQTFLTLEPGEKLHVQRATHSVKLIRPPGRTFFATLREKLGWGH